MPRKPKPLVEYRVRLKRIMPGERAVEADYPKNLGRRTKLGGDPEWIQGDETPHCTRCGSKMTFIAQIDSVEHLSRHNPHSREFKDQQWMFGDVGMIYVFYCFKCCRSANVEQDY